MHNSILRRFIFFFALLQLKASPEMHVEAQLVKLDLARIYRIDSRIKFDALATEINLLCSERSPLLLC